MMTQDGRDYPGGPLVVSDDLAVTDIGCDLDGYPVRVWTQAGQPQMLTWSVAQDPDDWAVATQVNPITGTIRRASDLARIATLEAENAVLKANPWMYVAPGDPAPRPVLHDPRTAVLESENAHLRALLNRVTPERLSAGWEHLPDVAAPPVRTMPARALRGGDGVPR